MKKFIVFLMIMVLLTGCGTTGSDKKEKVTFVLEWVPNTNHVGVYVAQKLGYYEQEGLEVTIQDPPEDGALPLVAAGKGDFAVCAQEELALALTLDNPMPVTAVAAILAHNTAGIISLKDKGITSPKLMEGYNYASWGSPVEIAIIKSIVESDGGDYNNVEIIENVVTDTLSALAADVDTMMIYYGWDGVAAQLKGVPNNYFYLTDYLPELDYYTPVIAANDNFLKQRPEVAKKFMKATSKGYQYAIDNPDEAANILCEATGLEKDLVTASLHYLKDQFKADAPKWGTIDGNRFTGFFNWLYDQGILEKQIPVNVGFSNDYLPE